MKRLLWTATLAALLLAAPAAAQLPGSEDRPAFLEDGLLMGLSIGGVGLLAAGGVLYYLGVGGLRHIDRNNVLEHPLRAKLLERVEAEPGIHLRELANEHGTAVTNTQWHLRKLEMAGLVHNKKVQGRRVYYPTSGGIAAKDEAVKNAAVRNENAKNILGYLHDHGGTNQRGLAEALRMNPGTVRWHLRKLEGVGLIQSIPDGAQVRYFALQQARSRPPRPKRVEDEVAVEA